LRSGAHISTAPDQVFQHLSSGMRIAVLESER
jgi:hypothetical protein